MFRSADRLYLFFCGTQKAPVNGSPDPICQIASGGSSDHGISCRAREGKKSP